MEFIPNDLTATSIEISKGSDYEYKGCFYNAYDGIKINFYSLLELLKELDSMFDRFIFPQVTHEYRTFSVPKRGAKPEKTIKKETIMDRNNNDAGGAVKNATFILQVKFRRNASWQGEIRWVDKNITKPFRSTLELIRLLDNAIEQNKAVITWDDDPSGEGENEG